MPAGVLENKREAEGRRMTILVQAHPIKAVHILASWAWILGCTLWPFSTSLTDAQAPAVL